MQLDEDEEEEEEEVEEDAEDDELFSIKRKNHSFEVTILQ